MCKKVPVCLKCVFASRIDFSLNLVPLYTTVSKNAALVSNVSAVNAIVGCKFACSKPETALEKSLTPRVPKILIMYRKCSN